MGQAGVTPALTRNRDTTPCRQPAPGDQSENPRPTGSFVSLSWNADRSHPAGPAPASDPTWCPAARRKPCPMFVAPRIRVVLAAVVAACLSALTLAPAHAAAYRYWGFYQLTGGAWTYAQKGPDQTVPKDGSRRRLALRCRGRVVDPLPARRPHLRPGVRLDPCRVGQEARRSRRRLRAPRGCRRRRDPARAEGPVRRRRHGRHERSRAGHRRRRAHREGPGLRRRRLPDERLRRRRQGGQPGGEGRRPAGDRRRAGQHPVRVRDDPGARGRTSPQRRARAPRVGAWRHTSSRASSCSPSSPTCSCARVRAPGRTAEGPRRP